MPRTLTIVDFHEFATQHGKHVQIYDHRTDREHYLFEDGARSNGQTSHQEPPDDPNMLLQLQYEYYHRQRERLHRIRVSYDSQLSDSIKHFRMGAGPGPSASDFEALQKLTADLVEVERKFQELQSQMPANKAYEINQQRWDDRKQQADEMYALLNSSLSGN